MGTTTLAASLQWSVSYPDHLCSAPVILCQVFSSTPVFFSSRSHLSFSCFLVSRRGFVDFHPVPPRINLVPPSPFPASPLQNVTVPCPATLHSPPLPFGRFSLEETSSGGAVGSPGAGGSPVLVKAGVGRLILISLRSPLPVRPEFLPSIGQPCCLKRVLMPCCLLGTLPQRHPDLRSISLEYSRDCL